MSSKADLRAMEAGLAPRPRSVVRDAELATTPFGMAQQEAKPPIDIPIDRIQQSPFQRRADFSEEDIESLSASIAEQGLITPIIVRRIGDESYELITGHKRKAAFKVLGRARIPAIVRELSDAEAARALTVDNTLHKSLTDWEIYKHAAMLLEGRHVRAKKDLETVFGMSHASVFNILAFGALPTEVHAVLDHSPALIGSNTASELKAAAKEAPQLVIEAVKLIASGKLKQSAAKQWIAKQHAPSAVRIEPAERHEFTFGDSAPVRFVAVGGDFRISSDEIDPAKLVELIKANLDALKKSGS